MKGPHKVFSTAIFLVILVLTACSGGDSSDPGAGTEAGSSPAVGTVPAQNPPSIDPIPPQGSVQAVATHVGLSAQALIQAERFMCVCGCNLRLGECTCEKDPGSVTMKRHLQSLVDQGMTPSEVTEAMVEKFGQAVLP